MAALNAALYSVLALVVFGLGYWAVVRILPVQLWKELVERQNMAVAILAGALAIALALIIAAAFH